MSTGGLIMWRESDRRVVILAGVLAVVLGVLISILYVVFTAVRIDGGSMEPVLRHEDRVLVTKGYDTPAQGDIVAASVADERGGPVGVIKRVVALGGDTVEVVGDHVYVNGQRVPGGTTGPDAEPHIAPFVVPAGHVYLLGDNRAVSYDSRIVGPVPLADVTGVVVAIIAPLDRFSIID